MKKKFITFGSPSLGEEEIAEVVKCMKEGWIGTGPRAKKFETMFKNLKGSKYAVAVNSCTAALHLSLMAIGIKANDEVILPTLTFASTANSIIHSGAIPVFVDCQKESMNIDPQEIERKITDKTKAIVVVHMAGRMCQMKAIKKIARKHKLKIIEDCAHAIESQEGKNNAGTIGDLGCFSFYATKNITTGEGGMVITNNKKYAEKIKNLALHGMNKDAWHRYSDKGYKHYYVDYPGYKYNMTDIQAALGIKQLAKLHKFRARREKIWNQYNQNLQDIPVYLPAPTEKDTKHAYHLYTILLKIEKIEITRDQFLEEMTKKKIGVGVHYKSIHLHPYYKKTFKHKPNDFPNAKWISERTVSLPLSPNLSDSEIEYIIKSTKAILKTYAN